MQRILILTTLATLLLLSACGGEDQPTSGQPIDDSQGHGIDIEFVNTWQGQPLKLGEVYTTPSGHRINLNFAKYIASGVIAYKKGGGEHFIPDSYQIIDAAASEGKSVFKAGNIPAGEYTGYSFFIGLAKKTNHLDPVKDLGEDHPLFDPEMHWSWNPDAGFKFMSVLGQVDVSEPLDEGELKTALEYEIAEDSRLSEIKVLQGQPLTVTESDFGKNTTYTVNVEWSKLFEGIDLQEDYMTHSTGSGAALADRLVDNWPNMFSVAQAQ
ncbi:MAG: MbnP family protein [Bacteroidota bacterium]